ncbi:hypothetical protein BDR07DRAFT_220023 [Suillus spraguei]|nr:hypothetical protein BDR07DRAFT_573976 [Suillus spraguei]KAG2359370.1 hypothetical protein BDR07DRAFT_220023 [Suillus spraguei]
MPQVSNDPIWWPFINLNIFLSYWTAAAGVVVIYDWVVTLGQEIELIWRQRWSLITVLYLVIRYIGIPYSVVNVLSSIPFVSPTDIVSIVINSVLNGTNVVMAAMLGVIMITRLYAMYQKSRIMLIFLVIIFLVVNIACGVMAIITLMHIMAVELMISGTYMCDYIYEGNFQFLATMLWVLNTIWEVLALCLSVGIAVKYFRDLRRLDQSTGSTIGDCFKVLIKSHVLYFASFAGLSCFQLIILSPKVSNPNNINTLKIDGPLQVFYSVQMFVLGPRLILSVREYNAKLANDSESDAEISMNSVVFQRRVHVSTSSTV